jgi:hypothetical protein
MKKRDPLLRQNAMPARAFHRNVRDNFQTGAVILFDKSFKDMLMRKPALVGICFAGEPGSPLTKSRE